MTEIWPGRPFPLGAAPMAGRATPHATRTERMGRPANAVHYHVGRLLRVGLLERAGERRSGGRREAFLPPALSDWFVTRGWTPFAFQQEVWNAYLAGESGLLHAATGTGKTRTVEALAEVLHDVHFRVAGQETEARPEALGRACQDLPGVATVRSEVAEEEHQPPHRRLVLRPDQSAHRQLPRQMACRQRPGARPPGRSLRYGSS